MTAIDQSEAEGAPIRRRAEREVFANRFITVYDDDVTMGSDHGRYLRIVQSGGRPGVAMLACAREQYALVQTYRYPIGDWEWGIPRGFAHGDDPLESARNELREELGAHPVEVIPIGALTPNSGLLADRVHVFYARYEKASTDPIDTDEIVKIRWIDLPTLLREVAVGDIVDGFTMSALTLAIAHGLLELPK